MSEGVSDKRLEDAEKILRQVLAEQRMGGEADPRLPKYVAIDYVQVAAGLLNRKLAIRYTDLLIAKKRIQYDGFHVRIILPALDAHLMRIE